MTELFYWRISKCQYQGAKNRMDKIREEFEKWVSTQKKSCDNCLRHQFCLDSMSLFPCENESAWEPSNKDLVTYAYEAGHKSRDEEIQRLEEINKKRSGIIEVLSNYINNSLWSTQNLLEEISKLKQAEDFNDKESSKSENKKVIEALEDIYGRLYHQNMLDKKQISGIKFIIKQALKDGE